MSTARLAILLLFLTTPCLADTIRVPGDHPTIQAAIDAASDGDLVEVAAGLYLEQLNPDGKEITVRGTVDGSGTPLTIVDGENQPGSVITVNSGESKESTIFENLVIRNGTGTLNSGRRQGGGIYVAFGDGATFDNCHVTDNVADQGGGIFCVGDATCNGCTFTRNQCLLFGQLNGSAVMMGDAFNRFLLLDGCTVTGNYAPGPTSWAVFSYYSNTLGVVNSTICGNDARECNQCSGSSNYVSDDCPVTCDPGDQVLTVNESSVVDERANRCECVKEWGSCGSDPGQWAVAYDLSAGGTAGRDVTVKCITYGSYNNYSTTNGRIELWADSDGGSPVYPGEDLVLLGRSDITILENLGRHIAVFDPPVVVPADTSLVVTMHASWSYDYVSVGGNTSPSASPTWYRDEQGFCSGQFRDLGELGYPDFSWVTELSVELGEAPCVADLNGDRMVDGMDLSMVLAFWGTCPTGDCPADFNRDGAITGADLSVLLSSWGSCQ
ncbi:MAG: dockerin type I domain-containing protein [Planctomycetota bacterium]|nr:dockerin type I domain-containing protein [Planctomycetota bacterium]